MGFEAPPPEALPVAAIPARSGVLVSVTLLLISVGLAVAGQIMLKAAMDQVGRIGSSSAASEVLQRALKEPRLWAGLAVYAVSAMFWLVVLSRVPLSFAYPFVGIAYVLVVAFARLFLHENVPALRWVGVVIIATGIVIVGFSLRESSGA